MSICLDWGSKDEHARRNALKKGINTNQTTETAMRWAGRMYDDEQFAREMGVHISYDDVRSHNTNLYRQGG